MSFLNILFKPYPTDSDFKKELRNIFYVSLFVYFFLIIFQPFKISEWKDDWKYFFIAGYSLVCMLVSGIFLWFSRVFINPDKWKVWKEIIFILSLLICIAIGNFYYSVIIHVATNDVGNFLSFLLSTFLVGIFPVFLSVILRYQLFLKQHQQQALHVNQAIKNPPVENNEDQFLLYSENKKEWISIKARDILFIESSENYVEIVLLKNGKAEKKLLRNTLKNIELELKNKGIVRTHRRYLVNPENIRKVEGNAQGYKIYFEDPDLLAMVSKTYLPLFNSFFRK